MTIDHYEPKTQRPDLINEYSNLIYACSICNGRKGPRSPSDAAREAGYRFFRPDTDERQDHFESSGVRLEPKTKLGQFSIEGLDLNRAALWRLRELRERLTKCERFVNEGIVGLRGLAIDQLPRDLKGKVAATVIRMTKAELDIAAEIDKLLRDHARSHLLDDGDSALLDDGDSAHNNKERLAKLARLEALYPGTWKKSRQIRKPRR